MLHKARRKETDLRGLAQSSWRTLIRFPRSQVWERACRSNFIAFRRWDSGSYL